MNYLLFLCDLLSRIVSSPLFFFLKNTTGYSQSIDCEKVLYILYKKYDSLKVGDIIAYEYNKVIIIHRIEKIVFDRGQYYYYTKGDYNKNVDNWYVEEKMIKGIVRYKIPYIGYPTVWINEW